MGSFLLKSAGPLVILCVLFGFVENIGSELNHKKTQNREPTFSIPKTEIVGERSPAFSPLELEVERLENGKFRIKSIDPKGPFQGLVEEGVLKEGNVYDSPNDIPKPH